MSYRKDGDTVTLTMTQEQYDSLLLVMGYASGAAIGNGDQPLFNGWLRLFNSLNDGNPHFEPYEVPEEKEQTPQTLSQEQVRLNLSSAKMQSQMPSGSNLKLIMSPGENPGE